MMHLYLRKNPRAGKSNTLFLIFSILFILVSGSYAKHLNLLFQLIGGDAGCNYYHHGEGSHPVDEMYRPQLTVVYTDKGVEKTAVLRYGVNGYTSGVGCCIMQGYPDENLVDPPNSNPGGSALAKEGFMKNKNDKQRRSVVQFDLSGIPFDAVIKSAHLQLNTEEFEGYETTTTGVLHVWSLKNSFEVNEVTFNSRKKGVAWETPGGDMETELFEFPMTNNTDIVGFVKSTHTMKNLAAEVQKRLPVPTASTQGFYFPPKGESVSNQSQDKSPADLGLKAGITSISGPSMYAIWRHGHLVKLKGDFNTTWEIKSARKTIHAALVGTAILKGKIPGIDQKMSEWNTDLTGNDKDATWKHVMTQTTTFDYDTKKPGDEWCYSDANPLQLCRALTKAWGEGDLSANNYATVCKNSFFDDIGMEGWKTSLKADGIRFDLDMEDMGRFGLLMLTRGAWDGKQLVPMWFVDSLETKQVYGIPANYKGPNDGDAEAWGFNTTKFPESPYGYFTWVNTDGDLWSGCNKNWASAFGAGGTFIAWNRELGIVTAGQGLSNNDIPTWNAFFKAIEDNIAGPNPIGPVAVDYNVRGFNDLFKVWRDSFGSKVYITNGDKSMESVQIYNLHGRLLNTQFRPVNSLFVWDASNYPSGNYYIRVKSGGNFHNSRITLF
ncbi:MAG: DNRLRE domain-containing protein [Fibrobacteria bacterium]|nr:DNRLRE domain-containing protein [Fibrobacteria bacterium]